jgi:tryptophan synthase alpha subunit
LSVGHHRRIGVHRQLVEPGGQLQVRCHCLVPGYLPPEIVENVAWLRGQTPLPICVGFGISRPEHVRMLAPVADGLIVGSAIVRRIAEAATKPREQVLDEIDAYAAELLAALGQ